MITLKDGTKIYDHHEQDCCESVYADWEALEGTTFDPNEITFDTLELEFIEYGFRINGYFVPCYNYQNGYYSDILTLVIKKTDGEVIKHSLTDHKKDFID